MLPRYVVARRHRTARGIGLLLLLLPTAAFVPDLAEASGTISGRVVNSAGVGVAYTRVTWGAVAGCGPQSGHVWTSPTGNWTTPTIPNGAYSVGNGISGCVDKAYLCTSGNAPTVNNNNVTGINFVHSRFTITAAPGMGGSMTIIYGNDADSPTFSNVSGGQIVPCGTDIHFTIIPATGRTILDVRVDNVSVGATSSYTFTAVGANHTISATFSTNSYVITAAAGTNGSISPSGSVGVQFGASQTFAISASTCFHVSAVVVDGSSVGAVSSYTFSNVQANHTISASFAANAVTAPGSPTATPAGPTNVNSFRFTWSAASPAGCVSSYQYRIDGNTPVDVGQALSVNGIQAPTDGTHFLSVRATDVVGTAGAWSNSTPFYYVLPDISYRAVPNSFKYNNPPCVLSCYSPTWDMFETYFGRSRCRLPNGNRDPRAEVVYNSQYKNIRSNTGGYCVGFSAASIINYYNVVEPIAGPYAMPTVGNLYHDGRGWPVFPWDDRSLSNPVLFYHATQTSYAVYRAIGTALATTPAAVYSTILSSFLNADPCVLLIYNSNRSAGHAVLPYRAEHSGNYDYVYIYDPNYHGDNGRAIRFDLSANTWSYAGTFGTWSGSASLHTAAALKVSELLKAGTFPWSSATSVVASLRHVSGKNIGDDPLPPLLVAGANSFRVCTTTGECTGGDTPPLSIEPVVTPGLAGPDTVSGYYLSPGEGYSITYPPALGDSDRVGIVGADAYISAGSKSGDMTIQLSGDGLSVGVMTQTPDSLTLTSARFAGDEEHAIEWSMSPSGGDSIVIQRDSSLATLSLPVAVASVTYTATLSSGADTVTRTLPPVTLAPGETHFLENVDWNNLDSTNVVIGIASEGDTAVRHIAWEHPRLDVVEGTPDSAQTTVFVELTPPFDQSAVIDSVTHIGLALRCLSVAPSADIDGNGVLQVGLRFDRADLRRLMDANSDPPTLLGIATLNEDSVYFEQTLPTEFGVAAVDPSTAEHPLTLTVLSRPQDLEQRVRFTLGSRAHWRLDVLDIQGRRVLRVLDEVAGPGRREVAWSRSAARQTVGPGVYFYRLSGDRAYLTSRFILLK